MTFLQAVKSVFSKYATFSGRARRREFWNFTMLNIIVAFVLSLFASFGGGAGVRWVEYLWSLAVLLPSLAVCCRRLHDIGRSGKWLLLMLVPAVILTLSTMQTAKIAAGAPVTRLTYAMIGLGNIAAFLICILFIFWYAKDSQPGENRYGPNPKGVPAQPFVYPQADAVVPQAGPEIPAEADAPAEAEAFADAELPKSEAEPPEL